MNAIPIDGQGNVGARNPLSLKPAFLAAILLASLALIGLGAYWLTKPAGPPEIAPAAAAVPAEPLLSAPPASCIDGKPTAEGSIEACL